MISDLAMLKSITRISYRTLKTAALWFVPWLYVLPFRRRTVLRDGKPYLTRIYLTPSTGKLGRWWRARYSGQFLHCFHMSDPDGLHNHPWLCAKSVILRGAYCEERATSPDLGGPGVTAFDEERAHKTQRIFWPGDVNMLFGSTFHRVDLLSDEVWTLFSAGPKHGQGWGFSSGRKGRSDEA